MSELTCPSCGKQLSEYTRFCPECGARLPEPPPSHAEDEPEMPPPATPPPGGLRTVVLPPSALSGAAEAPPAAPTVVLPPSAPSGAAEAPPAAPFPPTMRLDGPAQPAGAQPSLPGGALPPAAAYPAGDVAPAAPQSRRTLWWILGGAGCLAVLLLGACVSIGLLSLLGQRVSDGVELAATPVPSGAGGIVPEDSPLTGGTVLVEDDFSDTDTSDLDVSEDETSRSAYEDGRYVLEVKEAETVVWSLVGGPYEDVSVEVDAEVAAGADVTAAGLIFNYQDNANFYLYSVSNDGYYALEVLQDGEWTTLIDPTQSDQVDGTRNTLRVVTQGERIALYVNGALIEETADATFTSGEVGLAVSTFEASTGTIHFDNLLVTRSE